MVSFLLNRALAFSLQDYKISFCLDPFSVTCFPSNHRKQSCKTWLCIRPHQTKWVHLHLRPRNKVALWSVLIQASLDCNFESTQKRRSRSHWKPNWQFVWKEMLAAYACRCCKAQEMVEKKGYGSKSGYPSVHPAIAQVLSGSWSPHVT